MKPLFALFYIVFIGLNATAQTKEDYILNYAVIAVSEMEQHKIPASITLAQGILESRYGTSELSSKSNNHFGIKCHSSWAGEKVYHDDDKKDDCFRKYQSAEQSFKDHSEFLKKNRYAHLFELDINDYKGWAKGLRQAGYATDKKYPEKLIQIIEEYELYKFDTMNTNSTFSYVQQQRNNVEPVLTASIPEQPTTIQQPIKKPTVVQQKPKPIVTAQQPKKQPNSVTKPYKPTRVNRAIFSTNKLKTVNSYSSDTPNSIAERYNISLNDLNTYNEWHRFKNEFVGGMNIYLEPKKSKSKTARYHKVKEGQTMYQIAQQYGINTKSLYNLNRMDFNLAEQPKVGTMISLKKKVKAKKGVTIKKGKKNKSNRISTPKPITNNLEEVIGGPAGDPEEDFVTEKATEEEQFYEGRAIIYEPTPLINQQPVPVYYGSGVKPTTSNVIIEDATQQLIPKSSTTKANLYTVKKGDTLYGIARKNGISVANIKQWNNLTSNTIKIGQRLKIR